LCPARHQVKKLTASKATLMERVTQLEKELDKTRSAMNAQAAAFDEERDDMIGKVPKTPIQAPI